MNGQHFNSNDNTYKSHSVVVPYQDFVYKYFFPSIYNLWYYMHSSNLFLTPTLSFNVSTLQLKRSRNSLNRIQTILVQHFFFDYMAEFECSIILLINTDFFIPKSSLSSKTCCRQMQGSLRAPESVTPI